MGGATRATASAAVEAVLSCIRAAAEKEKLHLPRFGTFEMKERAARRGYHPGTGQTQEIPAKRVLTFRAAQQHSPAKPG